MRSLYINIKNDKKINIRISLSMEYMFNEQSSLNVLNLFSFIILYVADIEFMYQ